jgi:hypothetical protein
MDIAANLLRKGAGGGSDNRSIQLNIINQTSQPIQASQAMAQFNPEQIVLTTILKDYQQNGPISRTMRR